MGKKEEIENRYLPELEDKISSVFEDIRIQDSLPLEVEEEKRLKQMLKFLLSEEISDTATKGLEVKETCKMLSSSSKAVIAKGKFVIDVLKKLRENKMVKEIYDAMPISQGVIDFIWKTCNSDEQQYKEKIEALHSILKLLNKESKAPFYIKKKVSQYAEGFELRVSESGEVVDFITKSSNTAKKTNNQSVIFICVGDIVDKLSRVRPDTWEEMIKDVRNKDLICIYAPKNRRSSTSFISGTDGFVCKTFKEVSEIVENNYRNNTINK